MRPRSDTITVPFAAVVVAMLPAVLDQTILATALPTIAGDLGRLTDVSWLVTAYVVAAAAATPLWGKLGDRHGRRRLLEAAIALFLLASAACGAAQGITELIAARAVQGVAAGGLMALAMAAVGDLVSPRERARYQGYIASTFAVATVAGPLIGGVLVQHASWRWVFYVNLPLGLAALAGIRARFPAPAEERPAAPLDALGAALLAGATSAFMLACVWGGDRYAWGSAEIVGLLAAAVVLGAALAFRERRAADPIVPVALLRTRTVAVASAALFLATGTLFAINVFVPLFLQTTTGATPTEAGLLLVPMMAGITLSTNVAGHVIARTGRLRAFPPLGLALMTAGLGLLAVVASDPSRAATGIGLAVFGLGFGMVGQVLTAAVQNGVDRRQLGIAMAATGFFRGLGGAVGAAALGAVFAARAGNAESAGAVADGVQTVFLVAVPVALAALAITLLLDDVVLDGPQAAPSR
ncbi:MAG TPA: MDR family MFS transporter [Capillimicrobium sp.]|nr:MDR family MFS transporter [Capillimicrobium sp.]